MHSALLPTPQSVGPVRMRIQISFFFSFRRFQNDYWQGTIPIPVVDLPICRWSRAFDLLQ